MIYKNSPLSTIKIEGSKFLVKRDDLLDLRLSGNKARKLQFFLERDFPNIKNIVSFGGSQSNFMLALSELAILKGWGFYYYVAPISKFLKSSPRGNFLKAINNGMIYQEVERSYLDINKVRDLYSKHAQTYFFDLGGKQKECEEGLKQLASEIIRYTEDNDIKTYSVFLPSGTGASAFYLQKYLKQGSVKTCACIGNTEYLVAQMKQLATDDYSELPYIIPTSKKYYFGKLNVDLYNMYIKLINQTGIEFDLLYDPVGWITLLDNIEIFYDDEVVIYIHCGGVHGNSSMIDRYKHFFA